MYHVISEMKGYYDKFDTLEETEEMVREVYDEEGGAMIFKGVRLILDRETSKLKEVID